MRRPRPLRAADAWLAAGVARRMGAAAVAVTLVVLGLASAGSYAVTWSLLRRNEAQRLDAGARLVAQRVEQLVGEEIRDVVELAHNPLLAAALLDSHGREEYALPFLRTHAAHRGLVSLSLHDFQGRLVAAAGPGHAVDVVGAPWLGGVVEGARPAAELAAGAPGHLRIMLPVDHPDTVGAEGVLVAEIDLGTHVEHAAIALPAGLSLRVTTPDGRLVAASRAAPEHALRTAWALQLPAPAGALGLRFTAAAPEALLRPPAWLAIAYVAVCTTLVALALVLGRRAADRITRPLRELEAVAGRIAADGTIRVRVPEGGADEVARLGSAFNRMLAALEEATEADRAIARAEQLRAERALRIAVLAIESGSEAMAVVDLQGTVVFANDAAARLMGRELREVVGGPAWSEVGPGAARWRALLAEVRARGTVVLEETRGAPPDGAPRRLETVARHLVVDGTEYCAAVTRDVTERHQAEAALRLAGVGTLAAGVAHEINNPLTYVLGNVGFVRGILERLGRATAELGRRELGAEATEALEAIDEARQGAERVREIVRALRTFARPADRTREVVDLPAAVDSAALLARNEIRHRARLVVDAQAVPGIVANRQRVEQVLVNLLVNAAQAIPEGHVEANAITVRVRPQAAGAVVEVEDTGTGMVPEVRARVFEPFFTTKPVGTGTGLGLSICHGIVEELGGRIEVESEPGRGSTFRVVLPAGGEPTAPEPRLAGAPAELPAARILVVDDEPEVARAIARLLPPQVEALVEPRPAAALARLRQGEPFDAILCDVMMPELSGFELERAVRDVRPALADRIVFVTGGAFTATARTNLARSTRPCLEKPLAAEALRAALAEVLASTRAPGAAA